jgi:hypothetical protein
VYLLNPFLLQRLRTAMAAVLLVVLPLQGVVQLVAGLQGQRHVHTARGPHGASPSALRQLLDRLHAAQPPALRGLGLAQVGVDVGAAPHAHGGMVHTHGANDHDAVPVADADDAGTSGATAFLAWLPSVQPVADALSQPAPARTVLLRSGRDVAPALTPPRA